MFPPQLPHGKLVNFEAIKEEWSEYLLGNGDTIRLKTVAVKIRQLEGFNPDGNRIYQVASQNIVVVLSPEERKSLSGQNLNQP